MNELPILTPAMSPDTPPGRVLHGPAAVPERGAIQVAWARHHDEVRQAQRLVPL